MLFHQGQTITSVTVPVANVPASRPPVEQRKVRGKNQAESLREYLINEIIPCDDVNNLPIALYIRPLKKA